MKYAYWLLAACLAAACTAACTSSRPYIQPRSGPEEAPPETDPLYRVFLIGGTGGADASAPALRLLHTHLEDAGAQSAVVFLGDYGPGGLPDSASAARAGAEAALEPLFEIVEGFPGRIVFTTGDRDWRSGVEALVREEAFIEARLDRGNTVLPDDGFPGPTAVELAEGLTLIVLNTPWWLAEERPFGDTGDYSLNDPGDFLIAFEELLFEHRHDRILIAGHHPIQSNGPRGGRFSLKTYLTPLPILGAFVPLYRRFIGFEQDVAHRHYALFRREMKRLFVGREDLIYAAAHDHSLQYLTSGTTRFTQHHLISGSGATTTYAARGRGATFTAAVPGFLTVTYYPDHSTWLEAWTPDEATAEGRLLFRHRLQDPEPDLSPPPAIATNGVPDYRDSTVVTAINPAYDRGGPLRAFFLGNHRRDAWAVPVEFPVLDPAHTAGGLRPLQTGGRGQSVSLRLQAPDERQYVLRSIDKVAGKIWPPEWRRTLAYRIVQDMFSMLHPYGAFLIPPLADAAGIYHTNPRPFFVPNDPRLGPPQPRLTEHVALFEERPDEDMSDVASMGHASEVVGYRKMYDEINADNDHRVDGYAFARARLFDMWISDWDRHEDQWRWAAFEPHELDATLKGEARTQGKIYRPIPRDRDAAFMRLDGLFPSLYRLLAHPLYQDFRPTYGYLRGLNKNAYPQDRRLTAALTRNDWIAIADSLTRVLTDDVIEAAVRSAWPDAVYELDGPETIRILKIRRDKLPDVAATYYDQVIGNVVDVVGSHKHERFEVVRRDDGVTDVVVLKTNREGEVQYELYRRTFFADETREIRLYGLDGRDRFLIEGPAGGGSRVRAIGGPGDDTFVDTSEGPPRRTFFYDTPGDSMRGAGRTTKLIRSNDPRTNAYDPHGYKYDLTQPTAFFGSNKDDGLFLGGGVIVTRHGFRKAPYARHHRLVANVAARTGSVNAHYAGHFVEALGPWDLGLNVDILAPNSTRNYYGLGNESEREADAAFYQARLAQGIVEPALIRKPDPHVTLRFGPRLMFTNVRRDDDRFVGTPAGGADDDRFEEQAHAGGVFDFALGTVDRDVNPTQGLRLNGSARLNAGLRPESDTYGTLASDLTLYLSPSLSPQVTLATRVGVAHNVGTFPFYAANTLGGGENLRGYRKTRFAGRTSFYHNTDLRVQVARAQGYLFLGTIGLLGFFDQGRVWADGETSDVWHRGYGGGLWVDLFDTVTFSGTYGRSVEDKTVTIGFGFLY